MDEYAPLRCRSQVTVQRYRQLAGYVTTGKTPEIVAAADTPLRSLSHHILEPALLSLLYAPALRREHLSARTVGHVGSLIRVALKTAARLDLLPSNPMAKVELPRFIAPDIRPLAPDEISAVRRVCRDRGGWTYPFVDLALASGCRRGELLALEWADVNWNDRILSVSKSLEQTSAGIRVKTTKSGKPRLLTLPREAIRVLYAHFQSQALSVMGATVFSDPKTAGKLRPSLVSQAIVRRLHEAGIRGASLHTLRHTHATHLLSRGVPLSTIAARLGHADIDVTVRIYCHALRPDDQRAADAWDDLLSVA